MPYGSGLFDAAVSNSSAWHGITRQTQRSHTTDVAQHVRALKRGGSCSLDELRGQLASGSAATMQVPSVAGHREDFCAGMQEPDKQRHLLRLWLSPANGRPLPPVFAERYSSTVPGQRGGIWTPDAQLSVPLDPC